MKDKINWSTLNIEDLAKTIKPWELSVLLKQETFSTDTDILFENMMYYYVHLEMYDYAIVLRDEIDSRKLHPKKNHLK